MDDETEKIPILRFAETGSTSIEDMVAKESPLTIILNNRELVTLLCSPENMRFLAVGFLFSEGLLKSKDAIKKILVDDRRGVVRVETEGDEQLASGALFKRFITSGCGRGASFYSEIDAQDRVKIESQVEISTPAVLALVNEFQHRSQVYRATHGVHSAALCDNRDILVFDEDIGRHNAIDKIFGQCILNDLTTDGHIIVTSGRISSEILLKIARGNVPIIVSKSVPTNLGVRLANDLGVTLVGFVRDRRMNVYTHAERIATNGKQRCWTGREDIGP